MQFQVSLASFEDRLLKKELDAINIKKPVFISALPRAGTTLLLELLMNTGEFVSHTYRNMPFVLTPYFWSKFAGKFIKAGELRERAHGDGMMINENSPEAFEEIIWKHFWPSRYQDKKIIPWKETPYPEFNRFLTHHIKKLIYIGLNKSEGNYRYLSKNNLNIARINYLKQQFPDAIIIVPFRDPLQHAASLLKQHNNFLAVHQEDSFAKKYMLDIGHFDFGAHLKTVSFNSWEQGQEFKDATTINFWLEYWFNTYLFLSEHNKNKFSFFDYEQFCCEPEKYLLNLASIAQLTDNQNLLKQVSRVRKPKQHKELTSEVDQDLLNKCKSLFLKLREQSLQ